MATKVTKKELEGKIETARTQGKRQTTLIDGLYKEIDDLASRFAGLTEEHELLSRNFIEATNELVEAENAVAFGQEDSLILFEALEFAAGVLYTAARYRGSNPEYLCGLLDDAYAEIHPLVEAERDDEWDTEEGSWGDEE